jgi:hypothetical protein
MNFTESFQEFSGKLSTTDIALYAGVGLVIWVMFKDKLSPVQALVLSVIQKIKNLLPAQKNSTDIVLPVVDYGKNDNTEQAEDVFFKLVVSWKQTRDLAAQSGCSKAVEVADQMFPFLSPMVCGKTEEPKNEQAK